ncbi:hypothetical protein BGX34_007005, partial [Mortierella sp. NVP85]
YAKPIRIGYAMQRYFHRLRRPEPSDSEEKRAAIRQEGDIVSSLMMKGLVELKSYVDSIYGRPGHRSSGPEVDREREQESHESARHRTMMSRRDVIRAEAEVVLRDVGEGCQSLLLERIETRSQALKARKADPHESAGSKLRAMQEAIPLLVRDMDHEKDCALLAAGKRKRKRPAFYDMDVDGSD